MSSLIGIFAKNPEKALTALPRPMTIGHPDRPEPEPAPSVRPTNDPTEIRRFFDRIAGGERQ